MMEIKLVRHEAGKTITENLHLPLNRHDHAFGYDEIIATPCLCGKIKPDISITESDISHLYFEKLAQMKKEADEKQTQEEAKKQKELKELEVWKAEMRDKTFFQQVAALWRLRKYQG